MVGRVIVLPTKRSSKGYALQIDLKKGVGVAHCSGSYRTNEHNFTFTKLPAAFHLPEVCRQIYSEANLTAYRKSIFLYNFEKTREEDPITRPKEPRRLAMRRIHLAPYVLYCRIGILCSSQQAPAEVVPNVKTISLSALGSELRTVSDGHFGHCYDCLRGWAGSMDRRFKGQRGVASVGSKEAGEYLPEYY